MTMTAEQFGLKVVTNAELAMAEDVHPFVKSVFDSIQQRYGECGFAVYLPNDDHLAYCALHDTREGIDEAVAKILAQNPTGPFIKPGALAPPAALDVADDFGDPDPDDFGEPEDE